ncbi:MAG: hypothetical protein DMG59_14275 [Acidobacteria bacterium]|nr:MAG: hypothetical protein DMG59_14275 [Acidobacteriota bacterium]
MPDLRKIVRERIAALRLEPAAESSLTEELAQHLEDRFRDLRNNGATEEEAYRIATSELDDMSPIEAELKGVACRDMTRFRRGTYRVAISLQICGGIFVTPPARCGKIPFLLFL